MDTFTELVGSSALRDTMGVSGIPAPLFRTIARALKVVLAADGEIHPAELNAYLETCRRFGAPDAMLEELRGFNPATTTIESCFQDTDPDSVPARSLLYEVIKIAMADGDFALTERAAVTRAAAMLGIDDGQVQNLVALARAEESLRELRVSLLMPPGLKVYA